MNNIDDIKRRIKNKGKVEETKNNSFKIFMFKFFIVLLAFTFSTLVVKKDVRVKNIIYDKIYKNNFSFAYFKNIYNKYVYFFNCINKYFT